MEILEAAKQLDCGLELIGKRNIWIKQNYDQIIVTFLRSLIMEALQKTATGQLEVIGFDNTLSGAFSPFSNFISGEQKILTILSKDQELSNYLDFLELHIIGVQNTIQGRVPSLLEFREQLDQPKL